MATVHNESKKYDVAKIVIMPGDPNRAKYIAKKFLKKVKLINDVRGMTAYTGYYKKIRITVFPSGMGIPSMGIYSYELFKDYDVDKIIRIGSCGSYINTLNLNEIVLVENSISESNYALCMHNISENKISSSEKLNKKIEKVAHNLEIDLHKGNIFCTEVFYEQDNNFKNKVNQYDVYGVEMETFSLFTNAKLLKKEATALLTVSDSFWDNKKLSSDEREKKLNKMIILALESCLCDE